MFGAQLFPTRTTMLWGDKKKAVKAQNPWVCLLQFSIFLHFEFARVVFVPTAAQSGMGNSGTSKLLRAGQSTTRLESAMEAEPIFISYWPSRIIWFAGSLGERDALS